MRNLVDAVLRRQTDRVADANDGKGTSSFDSLFTLLGGAAPNLLIASLDPPTSGS